MNDQPERPESAGVASRLGGLSVNAGVLTVSAAAAYAVVRIMYAIYYGLLGASPEQVGLGYLETLSQGFVFIVVLVVGLLAAWLVLGIPVQAALRRAGRRPRVAAALLGLAVAAFFAGPLSTIGQRYSVAASLAIWGVAWGVGIVLGAAAWASPASVPSPSCCCRSTRGCPMASTAAACSTRRARGHGRLLRPAPPAGNLSDRPRAGHGCGAPGSGPRVSASLRAEAAGGSR